MQHTRTAVDEVIVVSTEPTLEGGHGKRSDIKLLRNCHRRVILERLTYIAYFSSLFAVLALIIAMLRSNPSQVQWLSG